MAVLIQRTISFMLQLPRLLICTTRLELTGAHRSPQPLVLESRSVLESRCYGPLLAVQSLPYKPTHPGAPGQHDHTVRP